LKDISSSRESAVQYFSQHATTCDNLEEIVSLVRDNGLDGEIVFADVTAGKQELLDFHKKVLLESQNFLVTANKNPISLFAMQDFHDLKIQDFFSLFILLHHSFLKH